MGFLAYSNGTSTPPYRREQFPEQQVDSRGVQCVDGKGELFKGHLQPAGIVAKISHEFETLAVHQLQEKEKNNKEQEKQQRQRKRPACPQQRLMRDNKTRTSS